MKPFVHSASLLLVLFPAGAGLADEIKVSLKITLPNEDARVWVDGKAMNGTGETRQIDAVVPQGKDSIVVKIVWEPNNYTKITRTRTLSAARTGKFELDLRKADPKNPDDIVIIFVPTPQDVVEAMCKLAKVGPEDIVYDLGCGDGRMVITAVKKFAASRGVGVDIDPVRVKESKANADRAGVLDKTEFRVGDVLKITDMAIADASVVFLYMGDDINNRLRPILQKNLKPGTRIVSHRFLMGGWRPDRTLTINSTAGYPCEIHLWEVKDRKK